MKLDPERCMQNMTTSVLPWYISGDIRISNGEENQLIRPPQITRRCQPFNDEYQVIQRGAESLWISNESVNPESPIWVSRWPIRRV